MIKEQDLFTGERQEEKKETSFRIERDRLAVGREKIDAVYFAGPEDTNGVFSSRFPAQFVLDGRTFGSVAQYVLFRQCLLVGDTAAAKKVLATSDPDEQKKAVRSLAREASHVWEGARQAIAMRAVTARFAQNEDQRLALLQTGTALLVCCDPGDRVWGCGSSLRESNRKNVSLWSGTNLYGSALIEVRHMLTDRTAGSVIQYGNITGRAAAIPAGSASGAPLPTTAGANEKEASAAVETTPLPYTTGTFTSPFAAAFGLTPSTAAANDNSGTDSQPAPAPAAETKSDTTGSSAGYFTSPFAAAFGLTPNTAAANDNSGTDSQPAPAPAAETKPDTTGSSSGYFTSPFAAAFGLTPNTTAANDSSGADTQPAPAPAAEAKPDNSGATASTGSSGFFSAEDLAKYSPFAAFTRMNQESAADAAKSLGPAAQGKTSGTAGTANRVSSSTSASANRAAASTAASANRATGSTAASPQGSANSAAAPSGGTSLAADYLSNTYNAVSAFHTAAANAFSAAAEGTGSNASQGKDTSAPAPKETAPDTSAAGTGSPWYDNAFVNPWLKAALSLNEKNKNTIKIIQEDITKMQVDAIVNVANSYMQIGGGINASILRAGGSKLYEECKKINGCKTGEAKITRGYDLPAKWVIHTVTPAYTSSDEDKKLLADCYRHCLDYAPGYFIRSIAFPVLSTGFFGFPTLDSVPIAIDTIIEWLNARPYYNIEVTICCPDKRTVECYQSYLESSQESN